MGDAVSGDELKRRVWSGITTGEAVFRHRFHRPGPQTPACNPELDGIPRLHPQALAKGFGNGELPFAADGHDLDSHGNDYSKTGGWLRVLTACHSVPRERLVWRHAASVACRRMV
jgi:hypothetical protein